MQGKRYVERIVRYLMASRLWARSALCVVYDEPDGLTPRINGMPAPGRFDRYSVRVPFMVVSPYARRHFVSPRTFDHGSILRFIEARFGLPALTRRDANANIPTDMFHSADPPPHDAARAAARRGRRPGGARALRPGVSPGEPVLTGRRAALGLALLPASCRGAGAATFVAFSRDSAGFRRWPRTPLGRFSAGGHLEGPEQYAYVNRPRAPASRVFETGTIIVRTLERGPPTTRPVFASVKRGGGYNARGDVGWEFFRLRLDAQGRVVIVARGLNPRTGLQDPYATAGDGAGCNTCHGRADARIYDGVLSPAVRPPDP